MMTWDYKIILSMSEEKVSVSSTFAPLPETERGRGFVLKCDPTGEKLLYCVANSVVIRDLSHPSKCEIVTCHAKKVKTACYSPKGFYICSGDITGTVKIWDTVNPEHNVKHEYKVLAGTINDISWEEDNKLLVCGEGKEKFAYAFSMNTGTSVGSITGHTKNCLTCDFKRTRPFSVITGSEDFTIIQSNGPPFKYTKSITTHSNFVNCVRYSPDGTLAASCGQDGKLFVYDSKTMDVKFELLDGKKAHNGGVYGLSWSPDSKFILSASADKTCKVWNALENKCETVFTVGTGLENQQLGCIWAKDRLISISLSGRLNFLNRENPEAPISFYWGHNKGIVDISSNKDHTKVYTASYDGVINEWDVQTGTCTRADDSSFKSQVTSLDVYDDTMAACGIEDFVQFISVSDHKKKCETNVKLPTQPRRLVLANETQAVVGCIQHLILIEENTIKTDIETGFETLAISIWPKSDSSVAKSVLIGGTNNKIEFYQLEGSELKVDSSKTPIVTNYNVTYIKHSRDGKYFAVGTANKEVLVYNTETLECKQRWTTESNRVNCISWAPDNLHFVSCGTDGHITILNVENQFDITQQRNVHLSYNVSGARWLDNDTIVSTAQQGCHMKFSTIKP